MKWYVWVIMIAAVLLGLYGSYGSFRLRKVTVDKTNKTLSVAA